MTPNVAITEEKKSESIFHPTLTDEQKRIFWTAVRLRPSVLLLRAACG